MLRGRSHASPSILRPHSYSFLLLILLAGRETFLLFLFFLPLLLRLVSAQFFPLPSLFSPPISGPPTPLSVAVFMSSVALVRAAEGLKTRCVVRFVLGGGFKTSFRGLFLFSVTFRGLLSVSVTFRGFFCF